MYLPHNKKKRISVVGARKECIVLGRACRDQSNSWVASSSYLKDVGALASSWATSHAALEPIVGSS